MDVPVKELEPYMKADFSPVEYARSIIEKSSSTNGISESVNRLQAHKDAVESAIASHVSENNEHLLERLSTSGKLKGSVESIKSSANALSGSLTRVQRDVSLPFAKMQAKALQMENMQKANDVLRRVLRFLSSVRKLKNQLNISSSNSSNEDVFQQLPVAARDVARSAQVLHEVENLLETSNPKSNIALPLIGIDVIDAEREWLSKISRGIRNRAEEALQRAIQSLNQSEVGASLQAFHNLECLPDAIESAIEWAVSVVADEFRNALDLHALSSDLEEKNITQTQNLTQKNKASDSHNRSDSITETSSSEIKHTGLKSTFSSKSKSRKKSGLLKPPTGMEEEWKLALWARMEKLESSLRAWALRIWNLQRVLAKKRDPSSHVRFADQVAAYALQQWKQNRDIDTVYTPDDGPETVYQRYWRLMCEEAQNQYDRATKASPFIRTTLGVQYYPKLRRLHRMQLGRINQSTGNKSVPAVGGSALERRQLLYSLTPFLSLYLARSLSRLNEPVSMMFPDGKRSDGHGGDGLTLPLPTKTDVLTFSKVVSQEIIAAQLDAELAVAICKGACKAVSLFSSKAESLIIMDETATQFRLYQPGMSMSNNSADEKISAGTAKLAAAAVSASLRTKAQVHNITLLDLVVRLYDLTSHIPENTTQIPNQNDLGNTNKAMHVHVITGQDSPVVVIAQKKKAMQPALENLESLVNLILGDYLAAAAKALEVVLARMHRESFSTGDPSSSQYIINSDIADVHNKEDEDSIAMESSAYMDAFIDAVSVLCREHLDKLPNQHPLVQRLRQRLMGRVIVLFLRNVCMIRPLDSKGRLRLIRDLKLFEEAILPLAPSWRDSVNKEQPDEMSSLFEEVHSLRKLLILNPSATDEAEAETALTSYRELLSTKKVRLSSVLLLIFASAPSELRSPHDQLRMSPERFGEWMDKAENGKDPMNIALLESGTRRKRMLEESVCKLVIAELDRYMQRVSANGRSRSNDQLARGLAIEYHLLRKLV